MVHQATCKRDWKELRLDLNSSRASVLSDEIKMALAAIVPSKYRNAKVVLALFSPSNTALAKEIVDCVQALKWNTTLVLSLLKNADTHALKIICDGLPSTCVDALKIHGECSHELLEQIMYAVKMPSIVDLEIGVCNLDDYGAALIAGACSSNQQLKSLNIFCNDVGEDGISYLADAIAVHPTLRSFAIRLRNGSIPIVRQLAQAIGINQNITEIEFDNNVNDVEMVIAVLSEMSQRLNLERLDFHYSYLNKQFFPLLEKIISDNKLLCDVGAWFYNDENLSHEFEDIMKKAYLKPHFKLCRVR